ncbi:P100/11E [Symbiodinium pilosum]|uniref:P100/11E protein n=1 Tax=Symbiodinium pilosum TaxID=2952 RepID=A0A812IRU2_SYMPI|nr:P100/11E [Symbiodinium pilosum]
MLSTMWRAPIGMAVLAVSTVALPIPDVEIATGVHMPMLAFGSYRGSLTTCSVQDGIKQWLQLGGRHLDTAHDYGTEPDVGAAIKASGVKREEIFLTTKIPGPIGRQAVKDMVMNQTLPKLGVDYVDLLLIHFPCVDQTDFPNKCGEKGKQARIDTWQGLSDLRSMGRIRAIGVSNYNAEQVAEVVAEFKEAPAVNQVQWHLADHNETLRASMRKVGTTLEAWASLAGPTAFGAPAISLGDARLKALAQRYNMTTAQVELRWETQKGVVPVTATCSKEHALGDLTSFNFSLSQEDVAYLDALLPADTHAMFV